MSIENKKDPFVVLFNITNLRELAHSCWFVGLNEIANVLNHNVDYIEEHLKEKDKKYSELLDQYLQSTRTVNKLTYENGLLLLENKKLEKELKSIQNISSKAKN